MPSPPVHISALGFVPRSAKQRLISVNAPACLRACLRARPTAWTRETTGREARIFFSPFPDTDRPAGDPSGLRLTHASHLNPVSGSIRFFSPKLNLIRFECISRLSATRALSTRDILLESVDRGEEGELF